MARYDDLNTGTLGYLTFISVILLIITVLLLQALCYNWIDWQEDAKLIKQRYTSSNEMLESQRKALAGYSKVKVEVPVEVPAADGKPAAVEMKPVERIQIPIDRAEQLILEKFKSSAKKGDSPKT